jgi:uncharacterized protein (DUF1015 family)
VPRVSPFVALRFDVARVGSLDLVTAPPYDVISEREHDRFLATSPYNIIRLDLGDRFHEEAAGPDRYARAASLLEAWMREGALERSDGPVYVPYEMRFTLHRRRRRVRGLVCAVELEDWGGSIVPHERTMPGPVEDRLRLIRALRMNLSCIEAVYLGPDREIARWLEDASAGSPAASVEDEDGVEHRLWLADPDPLVAARLAETSLMIADGHHRYATALRYRDEMRAEHGPGPWDHAMVLLVDATIEEPPVLPFHRVQLGGAPAASGARVRDLAEVLESADDAELRYGIVTHERGALVHRVAELDGEPPAVSRLHEQVLGDREDALRFTPDAVAAEQAVRSGEAVAAYFLPATDASTIQRVVGAGGRLPQKSTFFFPKPRTGLVMRPHDAVHAQSSPRARGATKASPPGRAPAS